MELHLQAVQSNTVVKRHDAVPAVAGPVDLVAESYATYITLLEGIGGGCCAEEEGESCGEESVHR